MGMRTLVGEPRSFRYSAQHLGRLDHPGGPELKAVFLRTVLIGSMHACIEWDREEECAPAFTAYYDKHPLQVESEFHAYATLLIGAGDRGSARSVVDRGLGKFPHSQLLADVAAALE